MSRFVLALLVLISISFCYPVEAVELLNNGDFSKDWTTGWESGSDAVAVNPEVFSSNGKVFLHLKGKGFFYLVQAVPVSSLNLNLNVSFKPNSIENLFGIGYAGFPFVGISYIDKNDKIIGNTWIFSSDGFNVDMPGAQELPRSTSTSHYIQVSDNKWINFEISIEREIKDHLLGVDPLNVKVVQIVLGVSNSKSESEGTLEVDYISLTGPDPSRVVSIEDMKQALGDSVCIAINLDTKDGGENALGFSITFDPAILTNPHVVIGRDISGASFNSNLSQITRGRCGIVISLPAGEYLSPDNYQIAIITFAIIPGSFIDSTLIDFNDQPISREIVDSNALVLSSVTWSPGVVKVVRGFEADVAPRSGVDGKNTIADWVQIGRFTAKLDVYNLNEFQKIDCAPRLTLGDGKVTIADWVQAGRYTAKLDPVTAAGGPVGPSSKLITVKKMTGLTGVSVIRAVNSVFKTGEVGSIKIELDSQGIENAIGFSLVFDPTVLNIENITIGNGDTNAMLNVNFIQKEKGQIGIAIALQSGETFNIGTREILVVNFTVFNTTTTTTEIGFGDEPIYCEVVDIFANPVAFSCSNATLTRKNIATFIEEKNNQQEFSLAQNLPNPFNAETMISFTLPEAGNVLLNIYSLNGQVIRNFINGYYQPGSYIVIWDGLDNSGAVVASGTYLYSLKMMNRGFIKNKRMILLR